MKKYFLIITVMLIAFQACKKDEMTNPNRATVSNYSKTETARFNPNKIENMDEYLTGFMKNLKTTTRNAETMSVEDAQWHISACLNFQFCNANVNRTIVEYDTVYTSIMVNDGYVSMNEINNSLQAISENVREVYNNSTLENKNILFIQPVVLDEVTRSGATVRTIVATSNRLEVMNYYFDNDSIPLSFFTEDEYDWRVAASILDSCINVIKPERTTNPEERLYFVEVLDTTLCYEDYTHLGYPNRLYVCGNYYLNATISREDMAYYLDSYLGLIEEFITPLYQFEHISSTVKCYSGYWNGEERELVSGIPPLHHLLNIKFGVAQATINPPVNN